MWFVDYSCSRPLTSGIDTAPQPGNTTQFPWPVSSRPQHTDTKTEMDSPHTNTDSPGGNNLGNSLLLTITSMPEIMEKQCLQVDATLPNHSVLSWCLKIAFSIANLVTKNHTQKVVKKIPEHYMESP